VRFAESESSSAASVKRTDLEVWRAVSGFFAWAAAKSAVREGLLGEVRVGDVAVLDVVVVEGVNWAVSSASWVRRRGSCDVIDLRIR
jgi:hypothetical protein